VVTLPADPQASLQGPSASRESSPTGGCAARATLQPSVLRHAPLTSLSLPQAVVAVGGATVAVCPDLYKSSSLGGAHAAPSVPASQRSIGARARSPEGGPYCANLPRAGSSPPASGGGIGGAGSSRSTGLERYHVGVPQSGRQVGVAQLGKPVETLLSTRGAGADASGSRGGVGKPGAAAEPASAHAPLCISHVLTRPLLLLLAAEASHFFFLFDSHLDQRHPRPLLQPGASSGSCAPELDRLFEHCPVRCWAEAVAGPPSRPRGRRAGCALDLPRTPRPGFD